MRTLVTTTLTIWLATPAVMGLVVPFGSGCGQQVVAAPADDSGAARVDAARRDELARERAAAERAVREDRSADAVQRDEERRAELQAREARAAGAVARGPAKSGTEEDVLARIEREKEAAERMRALGRAADERAAAVAARAPAQNSAAAPQAGQTPAAAQAPAAGNAPAGGHAAAAAQTPAGRQPQNKADAERDAAAKREQERHAEVTRAAAAAELAAADRVITLYALKYTDASEAGKLVGRIVGGNTMVAVDDRTNGLVVSAPPEAQERIRAFIAQIDVPVKEAEGASRPHYLTTRLIISPEMLEMARTIAGRSAQVSAAGKLMLVIGTDEASAMIQDLLKRLETTLPDAMDVNVDERSVQLTAYFIEVSVVGGNAEATAKGGDAKRAALPAALASVEKALTEGGFSNATLIAPLAVHAALHQDFSIAGTFSAPESNVRLKGLITPGGAADVLNLRIEAIMECAPAEAAASQRTPAHFSLQTTVTTKAGDYVVLAAGPNSDSGRAIALAVRMTMP